MIVSDAKRLKGLTSENAQLKKLLAESLLENEVTREALRKSGDRTSSPDLGAEHDGTWPERAARAWQSWPTRSLSSGCSASTALQRPRLDS